jgi:hypothetical protein
VKEKQHIPLAVVSSGLRARVIAIDGVDPAFSMRSRGGEIPALARALADARAAWS